MESGTASSSGRAPALTLREIVWSALCIALGLAMPAVFHAVGLGTAFLPMFLPVMAAGLLLRPLPAGLVGAATPMTAALLLGMPPLMPPVALVMAVEGVVLGAVASLLYRRLKWSIFGAAAAAVLGERVVMVLLTMALAPLFGLPGRLAAVGLLAQGLPGVGLLILAVPLLVRRLEAVARRRNGD